MAHASGQFEIKTREDFDERVRSILSSVRNIHAALISRIHSWYVSIVRNYAAGNYEEDFADAKDVIQGVIIQDFNISKKELLFCEETDFSDLKHQYPEHTEQIDLFKRKLHEVCVDFGYIDED